MSFTTIRKPAGPFTLPRSALYVLVAWLLAAGCWYALTSLLTIANFAWPQLAFDQLRSYTYYLGLPFPENVLQLENGHRPIIPATVRVAEMHAFAANQQLQIVLGTLFASLTAALVAVVAWRDRTLPLALRAAGFMLALIAVFWLGNARMLLHGNESTSVYLVTLCLVAGALMLHRCAHGGGLGWMLAAAAMATVATFCFATGIALFPTFFVIGWLLRTPWRHLALLVATMLACLVLYLFVLPGDGGVRGSLDLRPIDTLQLAARWVASPWITGWLGLADPQTHGIVVTRSLGIALKDSANFLQSALHVEWRTTGALLIGMTGFAITAGAVVIKSLRRGPMTPLQTLAFALMLFGAASGFIIGIGRLVYLLARPAEVFADRYLLWTCLFWLGICLLLISVASRRRVLRDGLVAFAMLLPIVLYTFHGYGAGWGAAVYRANQASTAAAISDVFDDQSFRSDDTATVEQTLAVFRGMREQHLGPYHLAGRDQLGAVLASPLSPASPDILVNLGTSSLASDVRGGAGGLRFDGVVVTGIRAINDRGPLAVIDPQQRIVGYALFSTVGKPMRAFSLSVPIKRGFEGYVKNYQPGVSYRLVSMAPANGDAWLLGDIPAPAP